MSHEPAKTKTGEIVHGRDKETAGKKSEGDMALSETWSACMHVAIYSYRLAI